MLNSYKLRPELEVRVGAPLGQPRTHARQPKRKVIVVPGNPPSRDTRDLQLAQLHERLTAAVETLVTGNEWRRALEFAARFRARSFNNTLLIWSQHAAAFERGSVLTPLPSFVAGFGQWLTLGRHVSPGQKGYMIFAPVTARFASSAPADQASWRRLSRNERPRDHSRRPRLPFIATLRTQSRHHAPRQNPHPAVWNGLDSPARRATRRGKTSDVDCAIRC